MIGIFIMYYPSIVYPYEIVNVKSLDNNGTITSLQIRCDSYKQTNIIENIIWKTCNPFKMIKVPDCKKMFLFNPYSEMILTCFTAKLKRYFPVQISLNVNLMALVGSILFVIAFLFLIITFIICKKVMIEEEEDVEEDTILE